MRKLFILSMLIVLIASSCSKDPFRYESEWLSPLLKTSLGITDIKIDSLFVTNNDSSVDLVFQYDQTLDSLLDILEVPDSLSEVSFSLTQLVLDDRRFVDTLTLLDMYPASVLYHNKTEVLPAQDIAPDQGTVLDVTEQFFTTATFKEGWLDIKIKNELPVEAELIQFELLNYDNQTVVVQGQFNNLAPNTSDSLSFDLAGKTVDGVLDARIKRIKTKSSGTPVLIDVNKGLILSLDVRDLKPQSATAIFPAQNLIEKAEETTYNFGGPQITVMRLRGGFVTMTVYSTIEEEIILDYQVPHSKHTVTKENIHQTFKIPAAKDGEPSKFTELFPIGEYEIQYKGMDPYQEPFTNTFYSILNARIEYTGIERSLSLSDSIYVKFGLIDIEPELAIGGFGKKVYQFSEPINIDAFNELYGKINLEEASLVLGFENSFGIEALVGIKQITGENSRTGKNVDLLSSAFGVPFYLRRGVNISIGIRPYELNVSLDKSNSNLKTFLENLPDKITPTFDVTTEPYWHNNYTDFAFFDSYLKSELELHVPLKMAMEDLKVIKTTEFNLNDPKINDIKRGKFRLKVANGYPWEMNLMLEFLDESGTVIARLGPETGSIIAPAQVNYATGKAYNKKETLLEFNVTEENMFWIKQASKIRAQGTFNTEEGKRFQIYSDYRIDLQLAADFVYEN